MRPVLLKLPRLLKLENTQRDVNIALMNELRFIFNKLNNITRCLKQQVQSEPLSLPGLVGGHCIGVDLLPDTGTNRIHSRL